MARPARPTRREVDTSPRAVHACKAPRPRRGLLEVPRPLLVLTRDSPSALGVTLHMGMAWPLVRRPALRVPLVRRPALRVPL
jgi:hypothetical protein